MGDVLETPTTLQLKLSAKRNVQKMIFSQVCRIVTILHGKGFAKLQLFLFQTADRNSFGGVIHNDIDMIDKVKKAI